MGPVAGLFPGADQKSRLGDRVVEQAWIWSVVGYTVLRFVIAWGAFADHGANVWIFGLLDIGTAWPYAKAVATICRRAAASEWSGIGLPVAVAMVSFFTPYAYLWFSAGEMPGGLRVGLGVCVAVLGVAAAIGVASKTKRLRAKVDVRRAPDPVLNPVSDDVIVDVRSEPAALIIARRQEVRG